MHSTQATHDQVPISSSATLILYVEVWTLSPDEKQLVLSNACRLGDSKEFITPEVTSVARGEGLAGRAWSQNSASIVQEAPSELIEHYCQRSGEELIALIAIPIFHQTAMSGVVVLGLGNGYGAAELWTRDDRDELSVSMSYYAGLTSLEFIHQYVRFPKGGGFPGKIWKSGLPRVADNLDSNADVVSTFDHDAAKITAAVGLPLGSSGGFASCVLLLLSARQTPLANTIELWECETRKEQVSDDAEPVTSVAIVNTNTMFLSTAENAKSALPEATSDWRTTVCDLIAENQTPQLHSVDRSELPEGITFALSIPVYRVQKLVGILNFMF